MSGLLGSGNTPTNAPISYSGLNVSSSVWNAPVPLCWGTNRLSTNAINYAGFYGKPASGGKGGGKGGGGKSNQQQTYFADCILSLCEGPLDADPQNIWANGSTTTTSTLAQLNLTPFHGQANQAVWSFWASKYPASALAYDQTAYLGAPNLALGESATIPDNGFECVRTLSFPWTRSSTVAGWINPAAGHAQSNAVDVLLSDCTYDWLTNPQYGTLMAATYLGSMTQWATYQRAQGLVFSPLLMQQEKATDVLDRWAQLTNSWIFWGGTQVLFVPLADAPVTGNGVTFTPQNDVAYTLQLSDLVVEKGEAPVKVNRKDPADCPNRTSVNITDRTLGYINNPIQYPIDQMINDYGLRDNTSISADEVKDPIVGAIIAQLAGKRAAYIRVTYQFKMRDWSVGTLFLPGTTIAIPLNYTGTWVRVRITDVSGDEKGVLSFDAEEFPGTVGTYTPSLAVAPTYTTLFPNYNAAPPSVNTPAIFEPPASFTGGTAKLLIAASGGAGWGGCDVSVSFDGSTYVPVGSITAAAPQGVLTAALAAYTGANPDNTHTLAIDLTESETAPQPVTTADATSLRSLSLVAPQPTAGSGVSIVPTSGELLAFGDVTATGEYTANLTYLMRGQYGTTANAHAIGEQFTVIDVLGTTGTAVSYDLPSQYIGQPIWVKLASYNVFGNETQQLSSCVAYQYTPTGAGYGTGSGGAPTVPTGLAGVASSTTAALTWNANPIADNVTTYRLFRATGSGASFGSASLIYQGYSLTYTDGAVASSTAYTYFLEATNAVGTSSASAGVTITTAASGVLTTANFVFNETPSGTVNGTNKVFTLSQTPLSGQLTLSVNGAVQAPSAYTLSGSTITFVTAPASVATILATYLT